MDFFAPGTTAADAAARVVAKVIYFIMVVYELNVNNKNDVKIGAMTGVRDGCNRRRRKLHPTQVNLIAIAMR
jgi:hypothetical protein